MTAKASEKRIQRLEQVAAQLESLVSRIEEHDAAIAHLLDQSRGRSTPPLPEVTPRRQFHVTRLMLHK